MCTTPTCPLHTTLCRPCIPCTDIPALAQISLPDTCSLLCANACNQVVGPLVLSCLICICMSHASHLSPAHNSLPDTCSQLCANACNQVVGPLVLSCLIGICMSHASYLLREAVSATLFTVVGIVCKVRRAVVEWFRV